MGMKLSDYINDDNRKLSPEQIRDFLIDYDFDEALEIFDEKIKEQDRIKELEEELKQCEYVKASVFSDREEYKNKIIKLTEENKNLESDLGYLEAEYLQLQEAYINLDKHYDKLFKDYDKLNELI